MRSVRVFAILLIVGLCLVPLARARPKKSSEDSDSKDSNESKDKDDSKSKSKSVESAENSKGKTTQAPLMTTMGKTEPPKKEEKTDMATTAAPPNKDASEKTMAGEATTAPPKMGSTEVPLKTTAASRKRFGHRKGPNGKRWPRRKGRPRH